MDCPYLATWCCHGHKGDLNSSSTICAPANKIIHLHLPLTFDGLGHPHPRILVPAILWLITEYQASTVGTIVRRRCLCPLFQPLDKGRNYIHVEDHSQCLWFSFHAEVDNMSDWVNSMSIGYLIRSSQNPLS